MELVRWSQSESHGQQLNVHMQTSDKRCPSGGSYWDCLTSSTNTDSGTKHTLSKFTEHTKLSGAVDTPGWDLDRLENSMGI